MSEYAGEYSEALAVSPAIAGGREQWYARPWATAAAMYVFLPAGLYLMWRYRGWSRRVKWTNTIISPIMAAASTYISTQYVWPQIF